MQLPEGWALAESFSLIVFISQELSQKSAPPSLTKVLCWEEAKKRLPYLEN